MLRLAVAVGALLLTVAVVKRKQRSIAFPACVLITEAAAEALRLRIKPYRSGLAFALLTRKQVAA